MAFAAMILLSVASPLAVAQIVAAPGSSAQVVQTQNGRQQVNIAKPSAAGVSVNNYSQFDVPGKGAILNNSPTIVQTQQAGYVNGNPNLSPGHSAGIIVNQVLSNSPSQLNGFLEVAGQRAEVVIANPNGLVVNGGGFINTSRAILTTGTPNYGANGSLTGFNVNGGNITVQGAGLNATNVDQVDLLARAIQVNAAIYANTLNAIAGSNQIDHNTLAATPIAGNGPAPSVAIDVSALGGMYANRIYLVSNEFGVGVSNKGVLAAQAGDLTLQSNGQLVLAGTTNASGSINASATQGIDNSGTTYAQHDVVATTGAALTNAGVLAAQNNTTINAGSVASTGTLGAGVNSDGTIASSGDLNVMSSGAVSATGRNEGGGNTTIQGASLNLAGSNTSANGALALSATNGDMNLSGASSTAGGTLVVNAAGTLTNDGGKLSSGAAMQVAAGNLSNAKGQLVSQSTLDVSASGALNNRGGTMQAAGRETVHASSLDNTAGSMLSLNGDGMQVTTTGALVNGAGGTIGTNGALEVSAGTLSNQGKLTASGDASVNAQSIDNHAGSMTAGGALKATTPGALNNAGGTLSGGTTTVSGASIDNTSGTIDGDALAVSTPGALVNRAGKIKQYGANDQSITAGGALDNTSGTIASNANNLSVASQGMTNDGGSLLHSGTGMLTVNSKGALSNANGQIVTNGALALQATLALNNRQGAIQAARRADIGGASLDNTAGRIVSLNADGMSVTTTGALVNGASGMIGANGDLDLSAATLSNQGQLNAATNATLNAQSIDNHAGSVSAGGVLNATTTGALNNVGGELSGASTTVSASSIDNTKGSIDGDALSVSSSGELVNRGGKLTQYGANKQTIRAGGALDNTGGTIASNATNLNVDAQTIVNDSGNIQHAGSGTLALNANGAISNVHGNAQTNGALIATVASLDNTNGTLLAMQAAQVNAASGIVNRGGSIYGGSALSLGTQGDIDNTGGSVQTAGDVSVDAAGALVNAQGTISANGAHGTASVSAANFDNTGGKLTNAGDGATIVNASDVRNTRGTLGGNGDVTVNAQTLENDAGANLVASGAANLNVAQRIDNTGGTLFGGTALNVGQATTTVINDGGSILGGRDVTANVAALSNANGSIRANRDVSVSGAISGDGAMIAGRNLGLAVNGDYTNDAANHLHADGDMTLSATGTLTNTGTLDANGALTVSGQNVVNTSTGDINASNTTVNAANTIKNAGRIEGDTVTTHSATLDNTATVIGNNVTVNATDVKNSGAAAVIAGANSVHIYAANSVTNQDGALIYSAGNLEIGKDGVRDASGMLANQTNTLINSAANIEADGDIDIAARTVQNIRTGVQTATGTPQDAGSTTLTMWTAGLGDDLGAGAFGHYHSLDFPQWNWDPKAIGAEVHNKLGEPVTVKIPASQVTNLNTTAQTFALTDPIYDHYQSGSNVVARNITQNPTQWYNSLKDNGDGTVSITFWPDFDPKKNIRPDQNDLRFDISGSHDYVEKSRTVQTTTTTDQVINAGNAATIQAQGTIRINADGGTVNNNASTMAAGGDLVRRAVGGSVNDTGIVLQQSVLTDTTSIYYWHQKTKNNSDTTGARSDGAYDGIAQSTMTVDALPAIATANQNVQTNAASININSVDRQGHTVIGSGVTGGSADGTQTGMIAGQGGNAQAIGGNAAKAVSGQSSAPQTLGGATGGVPNLKLPVNGLYTYNTSPGASYLIATDPRLTSYSKFISSDYMLSALDLDPAKTIKRLGDGVYEQTLIRNQVTQLTGRTFLSGFNDAMDEYTALMNNGVAYAKQFDLAVGIALTPAQMAQLTTDMVWLVSQDVTLPDGSHQTVLVPTMYLAQANAVDLTHSGALVAGNVVNQNASGDFTNTGHVTSNLATTIIGNNIVNGGVIGSGGTTAVVAVQDVRNTSGRIGGGDVLVQAGRDVINETHTVGVSKDFTDGSFSGRVTNTGVDAIGTISATNSAKVIAGRDVNLNGATIQSGGDTAIAAGRDLNVGTTTLTATKDSSGHGGQNFLHDSVTQNLGSAIVAGGDVTTISGRDTALTGATVHAGGDAAMIAGGDLTVTASKDTHAHADQSLNDRKSQHTGSSYDEQVNGSSISAGGNATLAAGQRGNGNLSVMGSNVTTDKGGVNLVSTGDVTIGSVSETHDSQSWSHNVRSGALSKTTIDEMHNTQANIGVGSTVSGDSVSITSGKDVTVQGSNVVGTHDVSIDAVGDVKITTSQSTQSAQSDYQKRESGFLSGMTVVNQLDGGLQGYSIGVRKTTDAQQSTEVTNNASMIGSLDGNLSIRSGNDLHVTGSTLHAGEDLNLTGKTVTIDAAQNNANYADQQSIGQTGVTAGLSSPVLAAAQTANQMRKDTKQTKGDARLNALAAATTGIAGKNAYDAVASDPMNAGGIGVSVSLGTSHSNSSSVQTSTTAVGSTVSAGNDVRITATGAGANSNINVIGSDVTAGHNATLDAQGGINLQAAQNTDSMHSSNSGSSGSIGATYSVGGAQNGLSFQAGVSGSKGHGDGDSQTWTNTHISGGNTVTLNSGGDTNLKGAVVDGKQVVADVGGNLNIESLQDTSHYDSKQTSGGVSVSVCVPPICVGASSVAANFNQQKLNSDYASVTEQSGIQSGDGGFQLNVKGNTDLKGGVIASSERAVQDGLNSLTTGTLTYSDIENHAAYSGSSVGVSGGYGGGIGKDQKGVANNTNPVGGTTLPSSDGMSIAPPAVMSASGDAGSTTKSAISGGAIHITDDAKQQQLSGQTADESVAGISRDTTSTQNALAPIFDKDKIEAGFDITSQFVNQAGTFVANRAKEADAASKAAKDPSLTPEQQAAAQQRADQLNAEWGPGGTYRQVMTALTVAAGSNVTGGMGQLAQSATVAYLQELGANQVKQIADSLGGGPEAETARAALHAIVGCAGAAGAGGSCGAGAMGAAASSVIGSLLAPSDSMSAADRLVRENLVNSLVAGVAAGMGASGADVATAAGAAQIEAQNNQVSIFAPKKNPLTTDLVKSFCATGTCTDEQVKQLVQAQNQINEAGGKNAVTAAAAMAIVAAVPALAVLGPQALALALSNPAAAVNAGIITVETAAAIATNSVAPSVAIEGAGAKAGTVWDSIVATQPVYPGSVLPKSFELTLEDGLSVWVHGNATEHIAEYTQMIAKNNPPEVVRLATQQQLASLEGAVNAVTKGGVPYNQLINSNGWELKFAPPRQPGQLPVLIHALPTGK
ncbi:filamentous hemagglutinin N-terminal domain-containing protein [Caballeronia novacaledonica]|uniref:Filamentous hemagglutinin N-terminal domain-containing protein n=2 Tax=Caballeronia novacaledonica TaxID=1544861 RepID=A0AA37MSF4_9BURK|nr:hemagglutinin repeat-containing protein [Caballeronia novacaledonica]GJH25799.1 filamentous hemagglutinin N-terminal domain-containing protein [Caballeronia novacaledonica]